MEYQELSCLEQCFFLVEMYALEGKTINLNINV